MCFSRFIAILAIFSFGLSGPAQARSFWDWFFTPDVPDFERPYLQDGKQPHNVQWAKDSWKPEDWAESRGDRKAVLDDLYARGILTDQYMEDDVPVLEVGQGFMDLSDLERRRVAGFVDSMFKITSGSENGMFYLYHDETDDPVGLYTKHGLQTQ